MLGGWCIVEVCSLEAHQTTNRPRALTLSAASSQTTPSWPTMWTQPWSCTSSATLVSLIPSVSATMDSPTAPALTTFTIGACLLHPSHVATTTAISHVHAPTSFVLIVPTYMDEHGPDPGAGDLAEKRTIVAGLLRSLWLTLPEDFRRAARLPQMAQIGNTKVFLKTELLQALEAMRDVKIVSMDAAVERIQVAYRNHYHARGFKRAKRGVIHLQATFRARRPRAEFLAKRAASTRINAFCKGHTQHWRFKRQQVAATRIKAAWGRFKWRALFTRMRIALLTVHTLARSFILR